MHPLQSHGHGESLAERARSAQAVGSARDTWHAPSNATPSAVPTRSVIASCCFRRLSAILRRMPVGALASSRLSSTSSADVETSTLSTAFIATDPLARCPKTTRAPDEGANAAAPPTSRPTTIIGSRLFSLTRSSAPRSLLYGPLLGTVVPVSYQVYTWYHSVPGINYMEYRVELYDTSTSTMYVPRNYR